MDKESGENVFNVEKPKSEPVAGPGKGKYPKKILILIILTFVLIVVVILAFALGLFFSKQAARFFPLFIPESVDIPLNFNNPSVYRASFVYAFQTKVVALEEKSGKTILKTDLTRINNLPEFVIDENTNVVLVQNGIDVNTKNTNVLKPGTPVYVYLAYNLIEKKWLTTRIAIVKSFTKVIPPAAPTLRQATPSAKFKAK